MAEVAMAEDRAKMSTLQTLDGKPVNVVLHSSLNFVKGVVYSRDLLRYSM